MKIFYFIFLSLTLLSTGCGIREREEALEKKENEINQKEQRLLLLEKELQLKEEELAQRQRSLDSTQNQFAANDSLAVINPALIGNWAVTMRCTATTCEGSAVGDTKNETWEIYYQDQNVIVKAMADNKLVRTYTGVYKNNSLQLTAQQEPEAPNTIITVRLTQKNPTELEGIREIVRADVCHIVYNITLKKA